MPHTRRSRTTCALCVGESAMQDANGRGTLAESTTRVPDTGAERPEAGALAGGDPAQLGQVGLGDDDEARNAPLTTSARPR